MSSGTTGKYQLGGQHSIPSELRDALREESARSTEDDVLKQRIQSRSTYDKKNNYQKRIFDLKTHSTDLDNVKRPLTATDEEQTEKRLHKRSRWDVKTYELPEHSEDAENAIKEKLLKEVPDMHNIRFLKDSDHKHFADILQNVSEEQLTKEELKGRSLSLLLLKVKNGNTTVRKTALRTLYEKCNDFGVQMLFDRLLPILLDMTLEDQERHLMLKVVSRVLYQLKNSISSYTHKILIVVSPLLVDEDSLARETGRGIITTLSHATGLTSILSAVRQDIDHEDEYVRNITARSLAVVGKALGVTQLLPFLNAVCKTKKSWRARHTGAKIIQQLGIAFGIGILPHLESLLECIQGGLVDEHISLRILAANTAATLAQNCYPYGIEAFNIMLEPLWKGIRSHRGKVLASFLKCLGSLIPLMDAEYAGYYTHEIMRVVKRELNSPDDEMRKAVLVVLQNCCRTEGVTPKYLREEVAYDFFRYCWTRRTALDRQINKMVVYTTVVLSEKIGDAYSFDKLMKPLRDEAEPFRTMAAHAVYRITASLGTSGLSERLEERLIDALLIAFQEQTNSDNGVLKAFEAVARSLDKSMKPYLSPIISTILDRLRHKSSTVRQQAAELCEIIIPVIKSCGEQQMLDKLSVILYESFGEVYPEVLGSVLGAMSNIISATDISTMQPPINQILPTLTPILRNNNRKVQINTLDLIGRIATLAPQYIPPKEWMRICFELLEILRSTNKAIRRMANDTFGFIASAIGPQDVLVALLNNLKVQERQLRVCTAVAIGIVAKTCGTYTVLPALINEYKTPETNVQNGVLKALTFMFEYIGDMSQDYIYVITPLLEDALTDRDLVHRQTAADVIKHLSINCSGLGLEDAFIHLLNLLLPNVFETSPHVISRILEGLDGLCHAVGPSIFMNYVWAGLFHPAQTVRTAFWKVYNNVYIEYCDSLVPYYPLPERNDVLVEELQMIV